MVTMEVKGVIKRVFMVDHLAVTVAKMIILINPERP